MLLLSDCDTLFSTVSQIPFPDHREICKLSFFRPQFEPCYCRIATHDFIIFFISNTTARAGRADFIQPSLGPLQPNFEDFMDFDIDILNSWSNNRLAPVPEEQTEEILRAIEFPMMSKFIDTRKRQKSIILSFDFLLISQTQWVHQQLSVTSTLQQIINHRTLLMMDR